MRRGILGVAGFWTFIATVLIDPTVAMALVVGVLAIVISAVTFFVCMDHGDPHE
jgi:hypothetical protein